jgi:hypothetical protein
MPYTAQEADAILAAYRRVFPHTADALAAYWDFPRARCWSCLTTDFHKVTSDQVEAFHGALQTMDRTGAPADVGDRLRTLSLTCGVGYSLGISPWTDDLLLRTFIERTRRVLIILGHDWYPIVTRTPAYQARSPLERQSLFDEAPYAAAVPDIGRCVDCTVLFINLYPDFRPPGGDVMGALGDYGPWLLGIEAVCQSVARGFELAGIVSWGSHVWEAMKRRSVREWGLDPDWRSLGVMAVAARHRGQHPLMLLMGGRRVRWFPFAHPSFATNFRRADHWEAYQAACRLLCQE